MSKFSQPLTFFGKNVRGQKGVSLYLSIVIMVILLAIVLGMSGILLGQLKMMKGIENSVIAFYAADTGIEEVLMSRSDPTSSCTKSSSCSLPNQARYYLEIKSDEDENCSAANFCISSVGIYRETQRAIRVEY